MVESCPKDSPGQQAQTLLEAAKAATSPHDSYAACSAALRNLRDAIAREDAHPSTDARIDYEYGRATFWQIKATEASDRAQQAESTAAWHKAESGRLSAELALTRNQLTLAVERSERLSGQLAGCHYDLGEANKQRQRAEKAEAECREQRARAESGEDRNRDLSEKLIAAHGKTHAESERAKKAEAEAIRWKARANDAETAVAAHCGALPQFEGDPKACAFPHGAFSNAGPSHDLNPFADVDQLAKDASDLLSSDMGRVLARMVIEAAKKEAK